MDDEYDETIDISNIKSVSQLALENKTTPIDMSYLDEVFVKGFNANHLSASQINTYISCPLKYLYSNKIRLQSPRQSEEGFDVMEQGSLMHLCYELFGRAIKDNHIKSTDTEELYSLMYEVSIEAYNHQDTVSPRGKEKFVENIHHKIFLSTLQAGLIDDRKAGLLAKLVDYYIERAEDLEYFQNTEFEKEFFLDADLKPYQAIDKNDKGYFVKGFIDRFDNLEDQINIIDYKSKKVGSKIHQETQDKIDDIKDVQLALYILYASQEYPKDKYLSSLVSFKADKKPDRKTGRKEYNFANLVKVGEEEIYNSEFENKLKELIFSTKESIENGEFGFNNSDEKMCGYCDMKYVCHESVLDKHQIKEIKE